MDVLKYGIANDLKIRKLTSKVLIVFLSIRIGNFIGLVLSPSYKIARIFDPEEYYLIPYRVSCLLFTFMAIKYAYIGQLEIAKIESILRAVANTDQDERLSQAFEMRSRGHVLARQSDFVSVIREHLTPKILMGYLTPMLGLVIIISMITDGLILPTKRVGDGTDAVEILCSKVSIFTISTITNLIILEKIATLDPTWLIAAFYGDEWAAYYKGHYKDRDV